MKHQERVEATDCRCSDFCFDHPEYQVGPEPDFPEARWDDPTRFSYAIEEVRQNRLAVIEELLSSYDTDVIELNLFDYAPFLARKEIPFRTDTFLQFVRDTRALCDKAGEAQDRPKRLLVRAAASLSGARAMGIDLETIIREGIVDTVLAMPPQSTEFADTDPRGISELADTAAGAGVKIVTGLTNLVRHDAHQYVTREMFTARATNGYAAGARRAFFQTYYPSGYTYTDHDLGTVRLMGRPEILAHKDNVFFVRQGPNTPEDNPGGYGSPHPLPVVLEPGTAGPTHLNWTARL